jgi:hypothetical protein
MAVGYANYLHTRWSDSVDVRAGPLIDEDKQPAVEVDSEGNTHVVWIETVNGKATVCYDMVDASGVPEQNVIIPEDVITRQYDSAYPDLYIDKDDNVHIAWLEYDFDYYGPPAGDQIFYRMIDTNNMLFPLNNADQVTNFGVNREFVNIVTDQTCQPTIIYAFQVPAGQQPWEIWESHKNGAVWQSQNLYSGVEGEDLRRPSTDVFEIDEEDVAATSFQSKDPTDQNDYWDINLGLLEISSGSGMTQWITRDNDIDDIDSNIRCVHQDGAIYVVWVAEDADGIKDEVRIVALRASYDPNLQLDTITYGERTIMNNNRKVGESSNEFSAGLAVKKYPKVSAAYLDEISYDDDGTPYIRKIIQVDVIWTEWIGTSGVNGDWMICYSEMVNDTRSLMEFDWEVLKPITYTDGYPQITTSQLRSSTRSGDWLDDDGNFRIVHLDSYLGTSKLWYSTTRDRWKPVNDISTVAPINSPTFEESDMEIDEDNGLHVVYRKGSSSDVYYTYWASGSRPPGLPTWGPVQINPGGSCFNPRMTTYVDDDGNVFAIIVMLLSINNDWDLWFTRMDCTQTQVDKSEYLDCSTPDDPAEQYIQLANNMNDENIGIVWSEFVDMTYHYDIFFGIVDYDNEEVLSGSNAFLAHTTMSDTDPAIDCDPGGDYHILYWVDQDIYYNAIVYDEASEDYETLHGSDIQIDDQAGTDAAYDGQIKADRPFNRRDNNEFCVDQVTRPNMFLHITYTTHHVMGGYTRSTIWYTKLNIEGEIVVEAKNLLPDTDYYSYCPMKTELTINNENQLALLYSGDFVNPQRPFPGFWERIGYMRLDNNGETVIEQTYINRYKGGTQWPAADFDENDRLNVVFDHRNSFGNWRFAHMWEMEQ